MRIVIFALGLWNLAWWLMFATSRWFGEDVGEITPYMWFIFIMVVIVPPLVTLPALYLAWQRRRMKLAFWLVAVPWIYWIGSVLAFGIGVAIYGF